MSRSGGETANLNSNDCLQLYRHLHKNERDLRQQKRNLHKLPTDSGFEAIIEILMVNDYIFIQKGEREYSWSWEIMSFATLNDNAVMFVSESMYPFEY